MPSVSERQRRMMGADLARARAILSAFFALFITVTAQAQVQPSGTFTVGHVFRIQNPAGTAVVDGGGAAGSSHNGVGYLTEIGITNTGTPLCINDALISGAYHQLCFGANALGSGLISYNAYNGAAEFPLIFNVNGVNIPSIPGSISGLPEAIDNTALGALASTFSTAVLRLDYSVGLGAPPLVFRSSNSPCSINGGNGDGGSQVKSADNKCWFAVFPSSGVDIREFGASTSQDAGPPIRAAYTAAVASGMPLLFRPAGALYQIESTDPAGSYAGVGPYPNTVIPLLYFGLPTHAVVNNLTIDFGEVSLQGTGSGCTALPAGYSNLCSNTAIAFFDNIRNLTVTGSPTFINTNPLSSGPVAEVCAVNIFNVLGGHIGRTNFTGWGGIGCAYAGDWLVNLVIDDVYAPEANAFLVDFAFMQDVVLNHFYGRPQSGEGNAAVSIIYDAPNFSQNKTGVSFTSTNNVTLSNSDLSGYNTCFFVNEGTFIRSRGNYYHSCVGVSGSQPGVGMLVATNSAGTMPTDISSVGDHFSGNGNTTSGGADFALAGTDTGNITNASVVGGTFDNFVGSIAKQISAQTTHHINFLVQGNNGIVSGATVAVSPPSSGVDRIDVGQPWTPVLKFGGGTTGITYSSQGGIFAVSGRQITAQFTIITTSKGSSTGDATVTGLPYVVNTNNDCAVSVGQYSGFATSFVPSGFVQANTSTINIEKLGGTAIAAVADTDFNNATELTMSLTCQVN